MQGLDVTIHGECEPRWEPARQAFIANFRERNELGASVALYHEGRKVVDLWAGHMDEARTRPWAEHSIVTTASAMKGKMALAPHMLADQGKLDYDAPWRAIGRRSRRPARRRSRFARRSATMPPCT